jgi:hypothetical protein
MSAPTICLDKANHRYTVDGIQTPGVTEILAPLNSFRYVSPDALRLARELGSAVHRACELDDECSLDESTLAPVLRGYLAAWRAFREEHKTHWILVEEPVFNSQMGYAGTVDRYGFVDGEKCVVDLKSGAALYPSVGPQLAAYAKAIPQASPCTKRLGVLLKPSGHYQIQSFKSAADWAVFASLLTIRNFCDLHKITPHYGAAR